MGIFCLFFIFLLTKYFMTINYIWRSNKLRGQGIPWNSQIVNTVPDILLWEKDRVNLVVAHAGLYEVSDNIFLF